MRRFLQLLSLVCVLTVMATQSFAKPKPPPPFFSGWICASYNATTGEAISGYSFWHAHIPPFINTYEIPGATWDTLVMQARGTYGPDGPNHSWVGKVSLTKINPATGQWMQVKTLDLSFDPEWDDGVASATFNRADLGTDRTTYCI